jgi:hypothetical protein
MLVPTLLLLLLHCAASRGMADCSRSLLSSTMQFEDIRDLLQRAVTLLVS